MSAVNNSDFQFPVSIRLNNSHDCRYFLNISYLDTY